MNTIMKRLVEMAMAWLLNPENLTMIATWIIEYVDRQAKENPDRNYWDVLDEIIDMILNAISARKQ